MGRAHELGLSPVSSPGAPQHARGRLPPPDRPKPDRLMARPTAACRAGSRSPIWQMLVEHNLLDARRYWRSVYRRGVDTAAVRAGARRRAGHRRQQPQQLSSACRTWSSSRRHSWPRRRCRSRRRVRRIPVMAGFKWMRYFHGMAATPLTPRQICDGKMLWIAPARLRQLGASTSRSCGVRRRAPLAGRARASWRRPSPARVRGPRPRAGRVGRGRGPGVQHPVPVRRDADVPVLRHVLPDQPAARAGASAGLRLAAVARHRAGPRRRARAHVRPRGARARRVSAALVGRRHRARPVALPREVDANDARRVATGRGRAATLRILPPGLYAGAGTSSSSARSGCTGAAGW